MIKMKVFELANSLYKVVPVLYWPLYNIYKQISDSFEIRLVGETVRQGDSVLDVGANTGFYSRLLSRLVGKTGVVYSFEPEKYNYSYLVKHTRKCDNIVTVNSAVGGESGQIKIYLSDSLNVDHHTYDDGSGRRSEIVNIVSIDQYLGENKTVDFIKMDIQGHEYQALLGAKRTLNSDKAPKILFEYWPFGINRAGDDPKALLKLLVDSGYAIKCLSKDKAIEVDDKHLNDENYYVNIFAVKQVL